MTDLDPRRALQVTRYHTWPRLREQSVGEHSAQLMRILLAIMPDAPRYLLIHALVHDIGECVSGDPPFPVKRDNPVLKKECDRIEHDAHLSMCLPWFLPAPLRCMAEEDLAVFKLAEYMEMWEWGIYEQNLGNRYAKLVEDRCWQAMAQLAGHVPQAVNRRMAEYIARRLKHEGRPIPSSQASTFRGGNGRAQGNGEGQVVRGELEEAGRGGRVHDAGAQVGQVGCNGPGAETERGS